MNTLNLIISIGFIISLGTFIKLILDGTLKRWDISLAKRVQSFKEEDIAFDKHMAERTFYSPEGSVLESFKCTGNTTQEAVAGVKMLMEL